MSNLLVGNYGCGNFGDDLLLEACKENLNTKFKIMGPGNDYLPLPPCGFKSLFKVQSYKAIYEIFKAKKVIFGGGGLFNSDEPHSYFIWGQVLFWARIFKKETLLIGQSFNKKLPGFLRFLLKGSTVYVRDTLSLSFFRGSKLTADLVFSLNLGKDYKRVLFDPYICVSLRASKELKLESLVMYLTKLTEYYNNKGIKVVFLPFDQKDTLIALQVSGVIVAKQSEIYNYIKYSMQTYSGRLHAIIVSALLGSKQTPLIYANKMLGLSNDLNLPFIDLREKLEFTPASGAIADKEKLDCMRIASMKNFT